MTRPSAFHGRPAPKTDRIELRMEHTTPNTPSDALFVPPSVDHWSAPAHAIAHVLSHVRASGKGSASLGGSVHLN